jgi:hypothetical protein
MRKNLFRLAILAAMVVPFVGSAQQSQSPDREFYLRPSYWRPYDQRGVNVFETSKAPDTIPFEGVRVRFGAGFTQQYQSLKHSNKEATNWQTTNKLYPLQPGFMTAQADLFTDVQLADGIRLNVTTYLSARHHNEAWVKGGYIQFDKLPFKGQFWNNLMQLATIKVGHMEINYGDAHFRRPDGGHTLQSPFMEGNIMDAFATEIGGEVYLQKNGLFGMVGITNGMIKGNIDSVDVTKVADGSDKRAASIYLKGGIDKTLAEKLRLRFSASYYHNGNSNASGLTLYGGDRTGSNYQNVMEKVPLGTTLPASTAVAFSGRFNPGFSKKVDAVMLNAFVKAGGLEFFGTYEKAKGYTKTETEDRDANQFAGELIYRFAKDRLYVGGRYNTVTARLAGFSKDVTIDRVAGAAGWFLTRNVLLKAELVEQNYKDFPVNDYRAGGKFSGWVVEAVVGF